MVVRGDAAAPAAASSATPAASPAAPSAAVGIERPKLRNGAATPARAPERSAGARVTNQNTLIYVLSDLRGLHRLRARKAELARQEQPMPIGPAPTIATVAAADRGRSVMVKMVRSRGGWE